VRSIDVLLTELETYMHRTFVVLTVTALAGFATAVHAHDGAAARSTIALPLAGQSRGHVADLLRPPQGQMMLAKLIGKGEVGQPCHATYRDREVPKGTYDDTVNSELACHDAHEWIFCRAQDTSDDSNTPLCVDGYKD
jgi:hypothetical protein